MRVYKVEELSPGDEDTSLVLRAVTTQSHGSPQASVVKLVLSLEALEPVSEWSVVQRALIQELPQEDRVIFTEKSAWILCAAVKKCSGSHKSV